MSEEKICPMSFNYGGEDVKPCAKEKCAWWDVANQKCCMCVIANEIGGTR